VLQFSSNILYIIDSIPENQLNTARQLRDDLEAIKSSVNSRGNKTFGIELTRLRSRDEVLCFFDNLVVSSDVNPILHFECHGDESGLEFADKSFASWQEIKPYFQAINQACKCNLFITLASCNGANLISTVQPGARSPFCGMLGAIDPISAENAQRSFAIFYSTLIHTRDGSQALSNLLSINSPSGSPRYYFRSAEEFFKIVYKGYLEDHCNEKIIWYRARRLRPLLHPQARRRLTLQDIVIMLKHKSSYGFEDMKRYFFFEDLYPANSTRFDLTLEQVKSAHFD
jgi:hypothetical protein